MSVISCIDDEDERSLQRFLSSKRDRKISDSDKVAAAVLLPMR